MPKKDDMSNVIKDATVKGTIAVEDGAVKGINVEQLIVELLTDTAQMPQFATPGSMCFDIYADEPEPVTIYAGRAYTFNTGIKLQIPHGYGMEVYSRSGHGFKHGIRLGNCTGIIDHDYRDELKIRLHNDSYAPYTVQVGERIAQARLVELVRMRIVSGKVEETDRGGFGSTGKL